MTSAENKNEEQKNIHLQRKEKTIDSREALQMTLEFVIREIRVCKVERLLFLDNVVHMTENK